MGKDSGLLQRRTPEQVCSGWGHFSHRQCPSAGGCARAASSSLEGLPGVADFHSTAVLWGQERGGSAPNLHLSLCPHPGREESRYWSLQNMLRVLRDFPFSIPFPGCTPSEMSKVAQKQARMAPLFHFQHPHSSLSTSSSAILILLKYRIAHPVSSKKHEWWLYKTAWP